MSGWLHDTYPSGATIYAHFTSYDSSGASVTLSGLAVTDIEIYKNGSVTQRASDNGYALLDTDGIDFDSITGLHGISIDLSDNSDASFYAVGSQYTVVISSVTIDSQTVSFILGSFRIVAAESTAGYPNVTIKSGTGTGELSISSGVVAAAVNSVVAAASNIKKNTASSGFMFVMTDSTTHAPSTGLTVTATRAIDGGSFASCTNAVSEVGSGTYTIDLAAGDVNGNHIMLRFTATGADDLNIELITQP